MDTLNCPNCEEPMLIHEAETPDEPTIGECPECVYTEVVAPAEGA